MEAISLISSSSALAVAPRAIVPTGSGKCHRLQAFSRAAGASLVGGNSIRLLKDARENYPAWLDAIARARRSIHFESYIIHEDAVGEQFGDALIAKARDGLRVRVIYDWMGGFGRTSRRFWRRLRAGGEPCGRRRVTASMSGSWCRMEPTSRCYALSPEPATGRCWKPGVRVFEWKGPMLHAKTAVADGRWARVGSINLSIASWLGNYELDVVAEDRPFAGAHGDDVPGGPGKLHRGAGQPTQGERAQIRGRLAHGGSASRAASGLLRVGNTIGAAIADHRVLEPVEDRIVLAAAMLLLTVAAVAVVVPRALAYPVAAVATWLAGALVYHRYRSAAAQRRRRAAGRGDFDEPA